MAFNYTPVNMNLGLGTNMGNSLNRLGLGGGSRLGGLFGAQAPMPAQGTPAYASMMRMGQRPPQGGLFGGFQNMAQAPGANALDRYTQNMYQPQAPRMTGGLANVAAGNPFAQRQQAAPAINWGNALNQTGFGPNADPAYLAYLSQQGGG